LEVGSILPRASGSGAVKPGEPRGKDLNPGTAISGFPILRTYGLGEPAGRKIPLHYPRGSCNNDVTEKQHPSQLRVIAKKSSGRAAIALSLIF